MTESELDARPARAAAGPFAGMMLADMGADVIRVYRIPASDGGSSLAALLGNDNIVDRGRRAIALNMKDARAIETVLALVERADVLIEGFRPGVTERLGLGPEVCRARNPKLVYGRMTGWGGRRRLRAARLRARRQAAGARRASRRAAASFLPMPRSAEIDARCLTRGRALPSSQL